ncbi:radical SAM family heme chaperone HemW [Syntrophomonas palmitatica]|uniref:radical SAM family heme chaperone HemW n=1 Tax=Syntrophomonas palmitatica TaxID=402877 RepID=UPI0006D1D5AF|nr:radical SAM family heme chaperone HemW [Syntrophomonas palmitatica]
MKAINPSSLGIYIHVPFCLQKCRYCDFYSLPLAWPVDMASYNQALLAEISLKASLYPHQSIQSIYIGGGTPSLLSPQQIQTIITVIKNSFNLNIDAEISLEANPAALHEQKMAGLLEAGINRFSLGVQSFDDEELRLMGRAHNARQAYETIELFQRQGCKNFNIDLIYGLPGQSIEKWLQNLKQAAECNPSHLSLYLLQLEEHTPMGRDAAAKKIRLPGEDIEWEMYYQAVSYLQEHGYDHYELSNFCRPGYHCRHNLLYWSACEYLAWEPER